MAVTASAAAQTAWVSPKAAGAPRCAAANPGPEQAEYRRGRPDDVEQPDRGAQTGADTATGTAVSAGRGGQRVADRPQDGPGRGRDAQHRDEQQRGRADHGQGERARYDEHAAARHRQVHRTPPTRRSARCRPRTRSRRRRSPGRSARRGPGGLQPGRDEQAQTPVLSPAVTTTAAAAPIRSRSLWMRGVRRACSPGRARPVPATPGARESGSDHASRPRWPATTASPRLWRARRRRRPGDAADARAGHEPPRRASGHISG